MPSVSIAWCWTSSLAEGNEHVTWPLPKMNDQAISLNYTSGTTGNPRGGLPPSGYVVFSDPPKTSTGKVQKFLLREQARQLADDE